MTDQERDARHNRVELLMNYGWVAIDVGWMLEWNLFALLCIAPTLLCAVMTLFTCKRDVDSFCVTIAMVAWACMTCAWFTNEVGWWPTGKAVATVAAALCAAMIAALEIRVQLQRPSAIAAIERFRRLRIPRK